MVLIILLGKQVMSQKTMMEMAGIMHKISVSQILVLEINFTLVKIGMEKVIET